MQLVYVWRHHFKRPKFGNSIHLQAFFDEDEKQSNSYCRDHCRCPAPFILPCLGKRGIFTRSPLLWVFETLSFICYHVDLPRLPY